MAPAYKGAPAAALAAVLLLAFPALGAPPPAEAFGQLPALSQLQLSPDGKHLAVIQTNNGRLKPLIYDTADLTGLHPVVLPTGDWTIDSFVWANSSRLIMVVRKDTRMNGDEEVRPWLRAIAVDADGTAPVVLLSRQKGFTNNLYAADIVSVDLSDPGHVYAALYVPYVSTMPSKLGLAAPTKVIYHLNLFKVDVNTGSAEAVGHGEEDTSMWLMDGHGGVAARLDQSRSPLTERVFVRQDGKWKEIADFDASQGRGADILGLSADGASLVRFAALGPKRTRGLAALSMADGRETPLYDDPEYDIDVPLSEPWSGRIIGASTVADQARYRYFDERLQALQAGLEKAFPGAAVLMASWDAALDRIVFQVNGARRPPEFYLLDRATGKAIQIGSTYPGLDESRLGEIKPYSYKARDGLDIHAYLTLPPGRVPHKLPAVILPHGGPGERDQMQFAWLPQFLATRGYAVLQPNFRGSTGYGAAFREAGFGEWGRAMQNDVTDGVRKLIRDGIVDAGRICIVGASYGGYAALAGAAFTPELYACAAVWAPVTDPKRFLASRAAEYGLDSAPYSSWAHSIEGNGADLDAVSPLRQAARIRCPVLMLHGTSDSNVPVEQSRLMAEALRGAGKDVEYLEIERENHFLDDAGARVRFLTELERFLAAHIGT